jgi:hypothetical protein
MAIDNLNYYSSWLPAWQQTDKYSNLPWCLKSKNLDIFSSSKSVKATAFSQPVAWEADVIKQSGNLVLKTDWKVYTRNNWTDTLLVDPSVDYPVNQIKYTDTYESSQRWTPQDLVAKYDGDELKSFVVFTDRSSYTYSDLSFTFEKTFTSTWDFTLWEVKSAWYEFTADSITWSWNIAFRVKNPRLCKIPLKIFWVEPETTDRVLVIDNIKVAWLTNRYHYDKRLDSIVPESTSAEVNVPFSTTFQEWIDVELPLRDAYADDECLVYIHYDSSRRSWHSWNSWSWGKLYVDINWWPTESHRIIWEWGVALDGDSNYYYSYLPIRERKLEEIWIYWYSMAYWMKGQTFQSLYQWVSSWVEHNWQQEIMYDFVQDMWWENAPWMDIIWLIIWNEQVYMIGNLNWDWYIIPCDLTWWVGTPYVAYWCEFLWATNIDYLLYLVWKDRGISCLWAYNWQELAQVIGGNKESDVSDMIDNDEQYKFDWGIVNWRKNLILSTSDNRLFQYWQTYWGKWWTFIHELPSNAANVTLKANGKDLEVSYTITDNWVTTKYITKYQDDVAVKNYNTEWVAVYPMVIWNHLLEKEESDLYASYIIPSNLTKLEFWASANHYHFWTFKMTPWTQAPEVWSTWEIDWIGNPRDLPHLLINLEQVSFVEANGDYFTFRGVWELPVLSGNETWRLVQSSIKWGDHYLNFTEVHHFRKIWEITAGGFTEWEFRFTNLNNKLELPKSHTLQIMVKWIGTNQFTPELFSLDLVANQRDRW